MQKLSAGVSMYVCVSPCKELGVFSHKKSEVKQEIESGVSKNTFIDTVSVILKTEVDRLLREGNKTYKCVYTEKFSFESLIQVDEPRGLL